MCPAIEAMNSRKTFVPPGKSLMRHGKTRNIVNLLLYGSVGCLCRGPLARDHKAVNSFFYIDINICSLFQLSASSMKEGGDRNSRQVCPSPCQTMSWVQSPHFATICMRYQITMGQCMVVTTQHMPRTFMTRNGTSLMTNMLQRCLQMVLW